MNAGDRTPREDARPDGGENHTAQAARRAEMRRQAGERDPEPSLASRLGQIGILGWTIVAPMLLGLGIGHWMDKRFATGVFFSAPLLMIGAGVGLWSASRWMHRQNRRDHE